MVSTLLGTKQDFIVFVLIIYYDKWDTVKANNTLLQHKKLIQKYMEVELIYSWTRKTLQGFRDPQVQGLPEGLAFDIWPR